MGGKPLQGRTRILKEQWMVDFDRVFRKPSYTPTQLKKRIEDTFRAAGKKLGEIGKTAFFNDPRRKTALIEDIGKAKEEFRELKLFSFEDSLIRFEVSCAVNFNTLEDQLNYSLGAAIWLLDELRRSGKLYDAYEYLPKDRMEVCDEFIPVDFYHGVQMRYFGYASAEKCAEQLVTEDEK